MGRRLNVRPACEQVAKRLVAAGKGEIMSSAVGTSIERLAAFHELLLRMSGRLPDELVAVSRRWLVEGEL
ncbi:hypothetical protein C1I95_22430, partial [Micromonospora craterilacus]